MENGKLIFEYDSWLTGHQLDGVRIFQDEDILKVRYKYKHKQYDNITVQGAQDINLKEKEILVPESIGLYTSSGIFGNEVFIGFNNDKQILYYNESGGVYGVALGDKDIFKKAKCKLVPCKREDLKAGDTACNMLEGIDVDVGKKNIDNYMKILNNGDTVCADLDGDITNLKPQYQNGDRFKVVPCEE